MTSTVPTIGYLNAKMRDRKEDSRIRRMANDMFKGVQMQDFSTKESAFKVVRKLVKQMAEKQIMAIQRVRIKRRLRKNIDELFGWYCGIFIFLLLFLSF